MTIKYVVCPGYIRSKTDGDRHFITASQLIHLYGVDPTECIVRRHDMSEHEERLFRAPEDAIHLYPRYNGDYTLPTKENAMPERREEEKKQQQRQSSSVLDEVADTVGEVLSGTGDAAGAVLEGVSEIAGAVLGGLAD